MLQHSKASVQQQEILQNLQMLMKAASTGQLPALGNND